MFNIIQNFDSYSMLKVQEMHNPILNPIMVFFTTIGDYGIGFLVIAFVFLFFKKLRKVGFLIYLSQLLNIIVVSILKDIIQRPRPFLSMPELHPIISLPSSYSFPSGHASASFAFAVIIAYYLKKWMVPAYLLAITIAFSRVYVGVHYPSDIIVGALFGIASAIIIILIYEKWLVKKFRPTLLKLKIEN